MILEIEIDAQLDDNQQAAVQKVGDALNEFLVAPNETATDKNNALQKLCGEARKSVLNIQPKAKPEKNDAKKSK